MIRPLEPEDTDTVLEIWLRSSVAAHDFVPRSYWEGKLDEMRTRYLPDSRTFVYQDESAESVCGFVSLVENYVAALFVHPDRQGQGIGRRLLQCVQICVSNRLSQFLLHYPPAAAPCYFPSLTGQF